MNEIDDQMPREHFIVSRLHNLRGIFNAIFSRTATTKAVLPAMNTSIVAIVKHAEVIQQGIRHMEEGYFDSQELSNEFAHLTSLALALPDSIEWDGGYWGYALNLVQPATFKEGAEYCSIEQIDNFIASLNEVRAIKVDIRDRPGGSDDDA